MQVKDNELLWARENKEIKIPTKRLEDSDYDIYAYFKEDYIKLEPFETKMIPTGLYCAMSPKWRLKLEERGSTGTKGIIQQSGVIDSGYRGAIAVPITNCNTTPLYIMKNIPERDVLIHCKEAIVYPYEKALCQAKLDEVPVVTEREISVEELQSIPSERGKGRLGSSNK